VIEKAGFEVHLQPVKKRHKHRFFTGILILILFWRNLG